MTTRATHIELAEKLDTDSFIMCVRNFQNRRGKVTHLFSDNGTNFVGAERVMLKLMEDINERMGRREAALMEISWSFNPPGGPHFGGAWERLIRIIKNCLEVMITARKPRLPPLEVLRSALIQAEFILNSRPLTHVPIDTMEDEVLTQFHFLIFRAGEYAPPLDPEPKEDFRTLWKSVQHFSKHFWDRWVKEYLPTIIKRNKWTDKVEPIKVGDVVLMVDEKSSRYDWIKGRVIEVITAPDGQVRKATVQTPNGIFQRPAVKLATLDVRSENSEETTTDAEEHHVNHHCEVEVSNEEEEYLQKRSKKLKGQAKRRLNEIEYSETSVQVQNPEKGLPDRAADIPISKKAKMNFDSWATRQKLDVNKTKELRDRMLKKQQQKMAAIKLTLQPWYVAIILMIYFITSAFGQQPSGLIAYDCANPDVNMTSYSLLDVTSCLPLIKNLSITEVPIQVLQRNAKSITMVYQCKLITKRSIRHCGMHSHTSDYERGYLYSIKEFTSEECRRIQLTGTVPLTMSAGLLNLKRNHTTRGETLIIGSVWSSSCDGGVYRTPEYTWTKALVYLEYEMTLYNYMATVDHENDQIILRHGLVCPYSHGKCLDSEDGYSTWDVSLNQRCEDTEFEVIFEGMVNKTINLSENKNNQHAVYTSISDTHLFSIRTKEAAKICGFNGYNTDHPRIFILETADFRSPFTRSPSGAKNHDIFTYFNSKITLVENYVGQKLDEV